MRGLLIAVTLFLAVRAEAKLEDFLDFSGIGGRQIEGEQKFDNYTRCGAGFIITANGYVITDSRVLAGAENVLVVVNNKAYEAREARSLADNNSRVKLLKIEGGPFTPVVIEQNPRLKSGDKVFAADFFLSKTAGAMPRIVNCAVKRENRGRINIYAGLPPECPGAPIGNANGYVEAMMLADDYSDKCSTNAIGQRFIYGCLPLNVKNQLQYSAADPGADGVGLKRKLLRGTVLVLAYGKGSFGLEKDNGCAIIDHNRLNKTMKITIEDFDTLTDRAKQKITQFGNGSGFFITTNGYFITNHHVVDGTDELVILHKGKPYFAQTIMKNKDKDLALLKVEGVFESVCIGDANEYEVGQTVFVVGFPQIRLQGLEAKVTHGIISSKRGFRDEELRCQIDAAIQPGNSGGPVANEQGAIVGVAVSSLVGNRTENVHYMIKAAVLTEFLPESVRRMVKFKSFAQSGDGGNLTDAVKKVVDGTGLVICYAKGRDRVDTSNLSERERNDMIRNLKRSMLSAKMARLQENWKDVFEITENVLKYSPNGEAEELNVLAREKLGKHLVIRATVNGHDVKAKITPICGFRKDYIVCGECVALYDASKKRDFPVIAKLTYTENGVKYEGELETVYNWSGTKDITVQLR